MLTPRTAILTAALLFAAWVLTAVSGAMRPPASPGTGPDSYHRGREGTQALVALLEELGVPAWRQHEPPNDQLPADATLVLIAPDPVQVRTEPQPLRAVGEWVRRGGRVVVAPDFADADEQTQLERMAEELPHYDADVLSALGLKGVRVELLLSRDVPAPAPEDRELVVCPVARSDGGPAASDIDELYTLGTALPEVLLDEQLPTRWQTRIIDAAGDERILAAGVPLGAGEVVVISDATLFSNVTLRRGQNALWLTRLLLEGGRRTVVVDEFFHGLSVRGNAWWLLTQPAYAGVALCGLLLLGLWTWRRGVLLGPPLADQPPERRALGEYVDAMARFFLRSRDAEPFVLAEVRAGAWRRLAGEFGQPAGSDDLERLVGAVSRRDPARGQRVAAAFASVDRLLQTVSVSSRDGLRALQELQACAAAGGPHTPAAALRSQGGPRST